MTAREAALRALYSIDEDKTYMNAALNAALEAENFSAADRAFITELIYGVTVNRSAIDYIISVYSKLKIKKMSVWVLNILRLGIFQISYMTKIPQSAACNEAVKLARKYSHGAGAGFVNGVLRSSARGKDEFSFPGLSGSAERLSLIYSYPIWITKRLITEYGEAECERLYKENARPHGTMIRVNTLKTNRDKLKNILRGEGIKCREHGEPENCLIVEGGINIGASKAYAEGLYSLQNTSSQTAVAALAPRSGETVIDMCSAPGQKACAAAELMNNQGKIIAFDVYEHKIKLIENAAKRLGINIIEAKCGNSCERIKSLEKSADRVLADVPCSGLGVIHKKPDIKWKRREEDIAALVKIQREILGNAAAYVKPGGVLVYSTCTIIREENFLQTERFLKENSDFKKIFERQILTGENGESGFYICKMVRNGGC